MKIKIYQIDMERDEHRIAMMGHKDTLARLKGESIDPSIYDLVFDGEVEARDLEAVYAKFNMDHPAGYTGRSMSVSDVVQVVESSTGKEGFYFCDSIGFKEIPFQPELTKSALPRTIDVVLVEPEKPARAAKITATLEGMQAAVGGTIEHLYPFEEQVSIVCNQEGKLIGLPLNRAVYAYDEQQVDMTYSELAAQFRAERKGSPPRRQSIQNPPQHFIRSGQTPDTAQSVGNIVPVFQFQFHVSSLPLRSALHQPHSRCNPGATAR